MAAPAPLLSKGLDHVAVGESAISLVAGETGGLAYRGFDVAGLMPRARYESVVHLLLYGEPPGTEPPRELTERLRTRRDLPEPVERVLAALPPRLPPLEAMRTLLSAFGDGSFRYPPTPEQGLDLVAALPTALARYVRQSAGLPRVDPDPSLDHVANYLHLLDGSRPDPARARALERYFILLADHGMNASTFALRVVVSTQSDLVSAETAALGALKGPVHGGAPSKVSDMLDAVETPENARPWVEAALARRERLMGFGHRAYKVDDPRAVELRRIAAEVAEPARLRLAMAVEAAALDALRRERPGQRLFTNVEFYGAVVLEAVGLPRELFTPTFALARTAGWAAHAVEQAGDNRLIRPEVRYTGPPPGRLWPELPAPGPPR